MTFIPALPEAIDLTLIRFKIIEELDPELDEIMLDNLSAVYGMFMSLSNLLSPIIGGIIYDAIDYQLTMDVGVGIMIVMLLIYIFFSCGFRPFSDRKKELKILEEL